MSHVMLALIHEKKGEKSQALYTLEHGLKNNPSYFVRSVINNLISLIQDEGLQTKNQQIVKSPKYSCLVSRKCLRGAETLFTN